MEISEHKERQRMELSHLLHAYLNRMLVAEWDLVDGVSDDPVDIEAGDIARAQEAAIFRLLEEGEEQEGILRDWWYNLCEEANARLTT